MTAATLADPALPTPAASDENRVSFAAGVDRDDAVARAVAIFLRDGVVVLDDVIDPALVAACKAEVEADYPDMTVVDRERNYGRFDGRHTIPIRVKGLVADPAIFVPRSVEKIVADLLKPKFQIDSIGLLVSLPGSPDQGAHRDETLFAEQGVDRLLPPFAIAFALPLVPMDEVSGRTAFWRRSHRKPELGAGPYDFAPVVQPGSVMLWDYRMLHCGLANHGDAPRPVLFTAFCREWWSQFVRADNAKYEKFQLSRAVYDGLKPRLQRIADRAKLID